ncbi:MAG: Do family serine endopeptidase [Bacteroidetes bacterium]|nr:Do family serine endopeptidase [Bacteroidota bacterium]
MKKVWSIVLAAGVGGMVALGVNRMMEPPAATNFAEKQNVSFTNLPAASGITELDFTAPSEKVTPAVVYIVSTLGVTEAGEMDNPFNFFNMPNPAPSQGSGSGVIISDDGYIATNNHVIEGAVSIQVTLNDKRSYVARLVGADPQTDLALLKIDEKDLPFIGFGNSDDVKVGQWVLAVGNPFNLTSTVTAGIVSAKGRNINLLRTRDNQYAIENFIQTDAAVNPGNSGGALCDLNGSLIGINTAIATQTGSFSGYSFAVPVNIVKKVMDDLLKYGIVQRGFLGISIQDVDAKLADEKGLKKIEGVYVAGVSEDGAAKKAGIKEGDVVLKINDKPVNSSSALQEEVSRYYPGDDINVTIRRNGDEKVIKATLNNQEGKAEIIKAEPPKADFSIEGAKLRNTTREERMKLKISHGVVIDQLDNGAFKSAGIEPGFVITYIDKRQVTSSQEVMNILKAKKGAVLIEGVDKNGNDKVYGLKIH